MAKILITYYSRSGNTAKMAELVAEGARSCGVEVILKKIQEVKPDDLPGYEGIIIGSPTYYGSMAAEVKKLFDESVRFHGKMEGKAGAAFTSAGNLGGGNETTIMDILKAFLIHGMIIMGDHKGDHYGAVSLGAPVDERSKNVCRRLGERTANLVKLLRTKN